jgi:hypothetical protein
VPILEAYKIIRLELVPVDYVCPFLPTDYPSVRPSSQESAALLAGMELASLSSLPVTIASFFVGGMHSFYYLAILSQAVSSTLDGRSELAGTGRTYLAI